MADSEAARSSVHQVDFEEKCNEQTPANTGGGDHYRHLLTPEQEQFLRSVDPAEQDRIFRKVPHEPPHTLIRPSNQK